MSPYPALIVWNDACHVMPGAWMSLDAVREVGTCEVGTVCWVVGQTKKTYIVCQSLSEHDDTTGNFVIPRHSVSKMLKLKIPKKEK